MNYDDIIRLGELLQEARNKFFDPKGWDESMNNVDLVEAFNDDGAIGDFLSIEDRKEFKALMRTIFGTILES